MYRYSSYSNLAVSSSNSEHEGKIVVGLTSSEVSASVKSEENIEESEFCAVLPSVRDGVSNKTNPVKVFQNYALAILVLDGPNAVWNVVFDRRQEV